MISDEYCFTRRGLRLHRSQMNDLNRLQSAADLLLAVLSGSMPSAEALEKWPQLEHANESRLMGEAWYSLYFFDADEDIRQKEPSYDLRQRREMEHHLGKITETIEAKSPADDH